MHPATRPSDLKRLENRIMELARDKKSLQVRCDALLRACNGPVQSAHIAVVHGEAVLEPTLRVARLMEREGTVPIVRWARDAERNIIGIELASVVLSARAVPPRDGMAIVEDDDAEPASLVEASR